MPVVKGHLRCIRNSSGKCIRKVRISSHRRRIVRKGILGKLFD